MRVFWHWCVKVINFCIYHDKQTKFDMVWLMVYKIFNGPTDRFPTLIENFWHQNHSKQQHFIVTRGWTESHWNTNGQTDKQDKTLNGTRGWIECYTNTYMDRQTYKTQHTMTIYCARDGWTHIWTDRHTKYLMTIYCATEMDEHTYGQTDILTKHLMTIYCATGMDRHTYGQTDWDIPTTTMTIYRIVPQGWMDGWMDTHMDRQTYKLNYCATGMDGLTHMHIVKHKIQVLISKV